MYNSCSLCVIRQTNYVVLNAWYAIRLCPRTHHAFWVPATGLLFWFGTDWSGYISRNCTYLLMKFGDYRDKNSNDGWLHSFSSPWHWWFTSVAIDCPTVFVCLFVNTYLVSITTLWAFIYHWRHSWTKSVSWL